MGLGPAKAISPARIFDRQANLAPGALPLKRRRKKGVLNRPIRSSASNTLPVDNFATIALSDNMGDRKTSKNKEKTMSKVLGNKSIIKMAACSNQILHHIRKIFDLRAKGPGIIGSDFMLLTPWKYILFGVR